MANLDITLLLSMITKIKTKFRPCNFRLNGKYMYAINLQTQNLAINRYKVIRIIC